MQKKALNNIQHIHGKIPHQTRNRRKPSDLIKGIYQKMINKISQGTLYLIVKDSV